MPVARWILVLPVSFFAGLIGASIFAALADSGPNAPVGTTQLLVAALSVGIGAALALLAAHFIAPSHKFAAVSALALLLVILNILELSSALRALSGTSPDPRHRLRVAEALTFIITAASAVALSYLASQRRSLASAPRIPASPYDVRPKQLPRR